MLGEDGPEFARGLCLEMDGTFRSTPVRVEVACSGKLGLLGIRGHPQVEGILACRASSSFREYVILSSPIPAWS